MRLSAGWKLRLETGVVGFALLYSALRTLANWSARRVAPGEMGQPGPVDYVWASGYALLFALLLLLPAFWGRRAARSRSAARARWALGWAGRFLVFSALHRVVIRAAIELSPKARSLVDGLRAWTHTPQFAYGIFVDVTPFAAVAWLAFLFERQSQGHELRKRSLDLEAAASEARLLLLRERVNPHFLFNTLHTASALVDKHPRRAARVLERLRELVRVGVKETDRLVPLSRELEIVEAYVSIERERFGDRLAVTYEVDAAALEGTVPPLLLQPLVENAVRHGLARAGGGSVVVRARRDDGRLNLAVEDDGEGTLSSASASRHTSGWTRGGVGLTTTRARLESMFGRDYRFELVFQPGRGTRVSLSLPFAAAPAPDSGGGD